MTDPTETLAESRYLTFHGGTQMYALPAAQVSEVVRLSAVARVPQGPAALLGIANLRGAVVAVVGLRELVGQNATPERREQLALMLDHATPAALVIDAVDSLQTPGALRIDSSSGAWETLGAERLLGTFKLERGDGVAKILDMSALLQSAFAARGNSAPTARALQHIPRRAAREVRNTITERLVTFEVADQEFALPLEAVEEILAMPPSLTAVSRQDAVVLGFTAVRDALIPLLSLRGLLGFSARSEALLREKVVIVKVAGFRVGLVADAARSIIAADVEAMEPVPPVLAARTGGESQIKAVYRADGGRRLISILQPEQLFREDVMQRLAALKPASAVDATPLQGAARVPDAAFVVFRLGRDDYALPIDSVVEVADVPSQITRLPKTPKFLEGVINLRGEVLPVIDQRRRFEMPAPDMTQTRRLVVVKTERYRAGVIVDAVSSVLRVSAQDIAPPPELTAADSGLVQAVITLPGSQRLVLLLDPTALLTQSELGLLNSFQTKNSRAGV